MVGLCRRLAGDARANVALIFALTLVPVSLAVGGGIDYARAYNVREVLQNAIDASVLAGANADYSSAVATNVFNTQVTGVEGTIGSPSYSTDGNGIFTGKVSAKVPNYFLTLAGMSNVAVSVTASATKKTTSAKVCVLLTNKSASQALTLNGGVAITASNCEVDVMSTASSAAIFNSNTTLAASGICIASNSVIDNGGDHANLAKGCATATDPFSGSLPSPTASSCTYNSPLYTTPSVTLNPGVYCGNLYFQGLSSQTVTLNPGVYILKNSNWYFNSGNTKIVGYGVTIYFVDVYSSLWFNNRAAVTLSAPTAGTYSGILMYEPAGLAISSLYVNSSVTLAYTGLVYLPSRQLMFNSSGSSLSGSVTLVLNTLMANSGTTWNISSAEKTIASASATSSGGVYLIR
jgi:Flp pilus assembly protein TadG